MTDIDWSNAPEGATHYGPRQQGFKECWYKRDQQRGWYYMLADQQCGWLTIHSVTGVPLIPVPEVWTGSGLPPVGAVCEIKGHVHHELRGQPKDWVECVILAHTDFGGSTIAVAKTVDNSIGWGTPSVFRAIRTSEQIAEEERNAAIVEIGRLFHEGGPAAIYFAGYRKQEAV